MKEIISKIGMKKNLEISTITPNKATHGEFYFAEFNVGNGDTRKSPIFVLSDISQSEDDDIIVCKCTSQPARSNFDVLVQLKKPTNVRTNKIYTIEHNQLLFKIPQIANPDEYKNIIEKLKLALKLM